MFPQREQCVSKANSPFWETYIVSGNNITYALSALWCGSPRCIREPIIVQIKQTWYIGNATMTVIFVAIRIGNLSFY